MITSIKNPEVKFLRSLKRKKYREREKMFVLEGIRIIEDALADQASFYRVFYSQMLESNSRGIRLLNQLKALGVKAIQLDDKLFNEVADTETPQGIIAILHQPDFELEDILAQKRQYPHLVMLNGVQDPGNMGTILRTTAAGGWSGAILTKGTVDPFNSKSLRATMGAVFKIPFCKVKNLDQVWQLLREKGYQVVAADLNGDKWHFEVDFSTPTVVVVGNEGRGVEEQVLNSADQLVKIPMAPDTESLNVGIAAGIMIYEGIRQNLLAGI